jgi:hypothetical protein
MITKGERYREILAVLAHKNLMAFAQMSSCTIENDEMAISLEAYRW